MLTGVESALAWRKLAAASERSLQQQYSVTIDSTHSQYEHKCRLTVIGREALDTARPVVNSCRLTGGPVS